MFQLQDTYFVGGYTDKFTEKRKQNRGKLWDRYTNSSKSNRDQKSALQTKSPSDCASVGTSDSVSILSEETDDKYYETMEESRLYLLYNSEKSDSVQMHWEKSFRYRQKYVQTSVGDLTDILQDWPIIMKPLGTELVS